MKFGRFAYQERIIYGLVEGDQVVELDGTPFDHYQVTSNIHALSALKILTPCEPRNFYCAGLNYAAHIEWAAKRKGLDVKLPQKADVGYRLSNALVATGGGDIHQPAQAGKQPHQNTRRAGAGLRAELRSARRLQD